MGTGKGAWSWGGRVLTFKLNSRDWKVGMVLGWEGINIEIKQWGLERGQGFRVEGY